MAAMAASRMVAVQMPMMYAGAQVMNYGGYGYAQPSYGYGMQQYANPYGYSTGAVAYGQQVQYGQ